MMNPGQVMSMKVERVGQEPGYVKIHLYGPRSGTRMNVMTSDVNLVKLLGEFGSTITVTFERNDAENGVEEFELTERSKPSVGREEK